MQRRRVLIVIGVGAILVASGYAAITFVFAPFADDPGECGLGTGGITPLNGTESPVNGVADAQRILDAEFAANISAIPAVRNESLYTYRPPSNVSDRFDRTVRETAAARGLPDGYDFDGSGHLYYFIPEPNAATVPEYSGSIIVTGAGEVYAIRVGAC